MVGKKAMADVKPVDDVVQGVDHGADHGREAQFQEPPAYGSRAQSFCIPHKGSRVRWML
jgi:hypothetical protein